MDKLNHLVVFSLDDRRFAVPLSAAVRIERMVALTPLPKAPDIVTGIINFHGRVIPVVDIRSRFNMTPRPSELSDQLLIIQTGERTIAFIVDFVEGVIDAFQDQCADAGSVLPIMEYVKGVVNSRMEWCLSMTPMHFFRLKKDVPSMR